MESPLPQAVRSFTRRVSLGLFAGGLSDGLAAAALLAGSLHLALRTIAVPVPPAPFLLAILPLAAALGALRVRRSKFSDLASAAHLDRRLGLQGLLMAAMEADAESWRETLSRGISWAAGALPALNCRRLFGRPLLPALFLGGILLLPREEIVPRSANPLVREELEELEEALEQLRQEGLVAAETGDELEDKIARLEDRLAAGEAIAWSDVDALKDAVSAEKVIETHKLEEARAALSEFSWQCEAGAASGDALRGVLGKAGESGLLDALAADLAERFERAVSPDGSFDPSRAALPDKLAEQLSKMLAEKLKKEGASSSLSGNREELLKRLARHSLSDLASQGLTSEQMAQLARLLSDTAAARLDQLAKAGLVDPRKLAELDRLLQGQFKPGGT